MAPQCWNVDKKTVVIYKGVDIFYAGLGGGGDCNFPEKFSVPPQVDQKKNRAPQNDWKKNRAPPKFFFEMHEKRVL